MMSAASVTASPEFRRFRGVSCIHVSFWKKGVDRLKLLTYMPLHRTGRRDRCFSGRQHDGQLVSRPEKRGMVVVRLYCSARVYCWFGLAVVRFFDIVGLDEGTCGRRRPVRGSLGSGNRLIKSMPQVATRELCLCGGDQHVLRIHYV